MSQIIETLRFFLSNIPQLRYCSKKIVKFGSVVIIQGYPKNVLSPSRMQYVAVMDVARTKTCCLMASWKCFEEIFNLFETMK